MDPKIEIKEESPLSDDVVSQNKRGFFTNIGTIKTNSDAVFLDDDCDVAIKTEIKREIPFPDLCLPKERECFYKHVKYIRCETVICNDNCKTGAKTEIDLQNGKEFVLEDPAIKVKKCNSDHEMDIKIEIKEEPQWLETEHSSVCDDIKDEDFTPVNSPRLCREAVSGDSSSDSALLSAGVSVKNTSLSFGKNSLECESQESDVTKVTHVDKHVHLEQSGKCRDGQIHSRALLIDEGETSHKCNICDKSFTHLSALRLHSLVHEGKNPHKCEICEKSFTYLSSFKKHNLIHEGKKLHKCEVCEKSFTYFHSLKRHNLIHEGKRPHSCGICEKRFTHLGNLKMHYLIHEGKKPHKCEICEKSFTYLASLKRHNLIHEGKKPHKCEICEKSFTHLGNLKVHNLLHEGKKPHKCEICEKSFTLLSNLKSHKLIHEGKKPHKCGVCEKKFSRLSSLRLHNFIHEGKKPHKCGFCEKSFTQLGHLKMHNLIHEDKNKH